MLSKKVCKYCLNHTTGNRWVKRKKGSMRCQKIKWTSIDGRVWNLGYIYCPHLNFNENKRCDGKIWTFENPPEGCPYTLEHLMESQNAKK